MKRKQNRDSYVKAAKRTKEERKAKRKKSAVFAPDTKGSFLRKIEKILGLLCMALGALTFTALSIRSSHYGTGHSFVHYFYIFICVVGVLLFFKARREEQQMTRFRYYRSFLEEKEYMMLSDISSITNRSLAFLQKDLSAMIRRKLFLQADMNQDGTCLFLTKDAFRRYQRGQLIITAKEEPKPMYEETDSKAGSEESTRFMKTEESEKSIQEEEWETRKEHISDIGNAEDNWEESLHSINSHLAWIHDSEITKSVSDICIRGQQLLYFKDTGESKAVFQFLEYFLPVTNTILETYVELKKEGLEDQAVDLKVSLNTIQHSFDLFVEKLIEGKRVDVEEDIAAVKMMLSNN